MTTLPTGLRERKKARTRAAIREHAMRLFDEQGYAATTVDQIAEAADISPSTFFRYFPTKEDVVLADDYDPLVIEAVRAQPADLPPIEAIRSALRDVFRKVSPQEWERERARQRVYLAVPELRARAMQQYADSVDLVAGVVAERAGLPPDDFGARVLAGAVIGAALAALPDGIASMLDPMDLKRLDRALELLGDGLPLGPGRG
ncbi:acyl-CoA-like ligand-binding transcription factor [Jidongwangia harbinensis]|uniref:acyl-CoA-like ligand-binding transcription factor n=1 Tax=Jidongwangia harbinensis TaxID=2878561 RepID=UPI001CD9AB85|nr:TetR family transcriptional regulator [Jidongwangia harbinensis]MCA2211969.1 TetR family transcriptional regulator [Jidongwangia harbinensis]